MITLLNLGLTLVVGILLGFCLAGWLLGRGAEPEVGEGLDESDGADAWWVRS